MGKPVDRSKKPNIGCLNCEHYKEHPDRGVIYQNGVVIKEVTLPSWWACHHPALNDEEGILYMGPEDFCSRFEERKTKEPDNGTDN